MIGKSWFHFAGRVLVCGLAAMAAGLEASAAHIVSVEFLEQGKKVSIVFDTDFKTEDEKMAARNHGNYLVVDLTRKKMLLFKSGTMSDGLLQSVELELQGADALDPNGRYYLIADGLIFDGKPLKTPLTSQAPLITETADAGFQLAPAASRDGSGLYFAGEIGGASGLGPFFSVDAKVNLPLNPGANHTFAPLFDLKAGTSPGADPDSMTLGLGVSSFPIKKGGRFGGLQWVNSGKLEAQREFDTVNAVWDARIELIFNPFVERQLQLLVDPFAGFELGGNLKSPVEGFANTTIARPYVGTALLFYHKNHRELVLEASYIRRWPLRNEIILVEEEGDVRSFSIGRRAREYVDAKLRFMFHDYVGAYAGYEFGELPPSFQRVDHRFRLGILLQARRKSDN